jgi:hypothetical protein
LAYRSQSETSLIPTSRRRLKRATKDLASISMRRLTRLSVPIPPPPETAYRVGGGRRLRVVEGLRLVRAASRRRAACLHRIDRSYTAHSLSNVDYGETTVALSRPSVCYWYKQDLKNFLIAGLGGTGLINRVNWDQPKRQIVSDLVEMLCADQDRYLDELRILLKAVSEFRDFHHLERLEDGFRKAREAREAVQRLRDVVQTYYELVKKQREIEQHRKEEAARSDTRKAIAAGLV